MKMKSLVLLSLLGVSQMGYAITITNNIAGVGPTGQLINPLICIKDGNGKVTYQLNYGASVDGNKYSGNPYYVGGDVRFGGCEDTNAYLGHISISPAATPPDKIFNYAPPTGTHITVDKATLDVNGSITGAVTYTQIQPNFKLQPPGENTNWNFVGANLSGLEFGKMIDPVVIPNLSIEDSGSTTSDLADTQAFIKNGMNTFRVPLSWDYLQMNGPGVGDINWGYYDSYVKPLLESLTSAGVYTIVDLHTYMRYSQFGKEYSGCGLDGKCPDGTLELDPKKYIDIWTKLYAKMKADPKINMDYIMLDLVNEPVNVPNDSVFTIQVKIIQALRQQGYQGYILVEGNEWTGLHSWTTATWQSDDKKTTYSNATLFTRDNFVKAGVTDLSKIIINVHQYLDSNFSGTGDHCQTDLHTTGPDGFNLKAFVNYLKVNNFKAMVTEFGSGRDENSSSCTVALTQFLDYLNANSVKTNVKKQNQDYGFLGWTIWSTGHGWGNYNLRVTPMSYQMKLLESAGYLQPES